MKTIEIGNGDESICIEGVRSSRITSIYSRCPSRRGSTLNVQGMGVLREIRDALDVRIEEMAKDA